MYTHKCKTKLKKLASDTFSSLVHFRYRQKYYNNDASPPSSLIMFKLAEPCRDEKRWAEPGRDEKRWAEPGEAGQSHNWMQGKVT